MAQNFNLGTLGQVITVNTAANTATYTSAIVIGNSTVNVVVNSSSVYISGSPLTGTNTSAQYTWSNTQTFSNTITFSSTINGTANNSLYLGGTAAAGYQTTAGLSANVATLTANNASYLGGTIASGYQTTAGLSANVATLTSNNASYLGGTIASGYQTTAGLSANVATLTSNNATNAFGKTEGNLNVNNATTALTANNSLYLGGTIASSFVANTSAGLSQNTSGIFVVAGTGAVVNATGVHVNATYIGTISANNASFLGGTAAASYQLNSTLAANVAILTANNANNLGGVAASGYQTTAGLSANVATLTANNASYLGGTAAASYALLASPTFTGTVTTANVSTTGRHSVSQSGYTPSNANVVNAAIYTSGGYGGGITLNDTGIGTIWMQGAGTLMGFGVGTTAGVSGLLYLTSSNAGIGNTAPTDKLSVNGTTYHQGNVIFGSSSIAVGLQANGGYGTAGQVLTSNGTATYWSTVSGGSSYTFSTGLVNTSGTVTVNTSYVAALTGATFSGDVRLYRTASTGTGALFFSQSGDAYHYFDGSNHTINFGYVYNGASFRAPIFYDSNDTGYYADPNGTSNFNVITAAGRISTGYDPVITNSISCSNWFRSSGATGWYNGSYGGGIWMEDSTWVKVYGNKQFYSQNWMQSDSSVRAPIFYDSNDTGYYVDPNSTTRLLNLYLEGGVAHQNFSADYSSAAVEIREYQFAGAQTDSDAYRPHLGFHWGGRVASQIALLSNGWIAIRNNPGTGYESLIAYNGYFTGDVTSAYSDIRLKTVVGKITNAIDKVKAIETFKYKHNDIAKQNGFEDDNVHIGVNAQSVEAVLPEVVHHAPFDVQSLDGVEVSKSGEWYKTVQYERLVPLLIEAIKEQQETIDFMLKKINKLEEK